VVYMGDEDMERQSLNVFRMRLLGAEVRPVSSGTRTLKDAINETIRDWVTNVETTHYLLGSVVGPVDSDFITAANEQPVATERPELAEAFK